MRLYTLDEARQILAEETCQRDGHAFNDVFDGMGHLLHFFCGRCGVTFTRSET